MSYYRTLGLEREPFSTSPDPSFLFLSQEHKSAFFRLQVSVSLKRGLSVLMGDIGTGKTTLSRKLAQVLSADPNVSFHMILNPHFRSERQLLRKLAELFHVVLPMKRPTTLDYMEHVEKFLFQRAVEEQKTLVLLIDEAQILRDFALETLRILLNYETNEYKLLQLILVGQMDLLPRLRDRRNLWDRIALKSVLRPLSEKEVVEMVDFRLRQAGYQGTAALFTREAIRLLWQRSGGYPRRLSMLCHAALEYLVMHDRQTVDDQIVKAVLEKESAETGVLPDPAALTAPGKSAAPVRKPRASKGAGVPVPEPGEASVVGNGGLTSYDGVWQVSVSGRTQESGAV